MTWMSRRLNALFKKKPNVTKPQDNEFVEICLTPITAFTALEPKKKSMWERFIHFITAPFRWLFEKFKKKPPTNPNVHRENITGSYGVMSVDLPKADSSQKSSDKSMEEMIEEVQQEKEKFKNKMTETEQQLKNTQKRLMREQREQLQNEFTEMSGNFLKELGTKPGALESARSQFKNS